MEAVLDDLPGMCCLALPVLACMLFSVKKTSWWALVSVAYLAIQVLLPQPVRPRHHYPSYSFWLGFLSALGYGAASVCQRNPRIAVAVAGMVLGTVHAIVLIAAFRTGMQGLARYDAATPELQVAVIVTAACLLAAPPIRFAARLLYGPTHAVA